MNDIDIARYKAQEDNKRDGYKIWMRDMDRIWIKDPTRVLQRPHFDEELEAEILRVRYELWREERMGLFQWCVYMLIKKFKKLFE